MSVEAVVVDIKEAKGKKSGKNIVGDLDIDKLVKESQSSYGKTEKGLALQITTGSSIFKPTDDDDFIIWTKGTFWQDLTHLKGIPFGRVVQVSGKADSGKSTMAMGFMKEAQDQDVLVILWDAEKKFMERRFRTHMQGDPSKLVCVNTNNILSGIKHVSNIVKAAKKQNPEVKILIVWDSVGASMNSTEDNEESEDMSKQPGVTAKEISFAVKKINRLVHRFFDKETGKDSIAALVINQTYANIGSKGQTEKGGGELYYQSSIILQLGRIKDLNRTKDKKMYKYGIVTRAKVKKNHLFDGDEAIAEMNLVVSADGIRLADEVKSYDDIKGWDDEDEESDDE